MQCCFGEEERTGVKKDYYQLKALNDILLYYRIIFPGYFIDIF